MKNIFIVYYDPVRGHKCRHETVGSDLQKEIDLLKSVFPHYQILDAWAS
jgi:hypothetical protein